MCWCFTYGNTAETCDDCIEDGELNGEGFCVDCRVKRVVCADVPCEGCQSEGIQC